MQKYKSYIVSFIFTFLIAAAGAVVTYAGMAEFRTVQQPPLSPPAFLFPIVWTLLFGLMAFGAAAVYNRAGEKSIPALYVYLIQLSLNFIWCVVFFGFGTYLAAFIVLILLWLSVILMAVLFYRLDKLSGLLQIPYILWLTFAAYLNLSIYLLN